MFERLAELAREKLYLETGIHIAGNKELVIDNCRRIEEYNESYMRMAAGGLTIDIHGTGLRAYDFRTGGLVVRGHIESISFAERRNKGETEDKGNGEGKRRG